MNRSPCVVAHLSTVHTWNDTRIFQRMCRSLADRGFDVHFVVPCNDFTGVEEHDGVSIHPVPAKGGRLLRATLTAWEVMRTARRVSPDIYHFHDPELMWVGLLLRFAGHEVVQDVHEDFVGDVLEKPWIPALLRRPVGWMVARLESFTATRLSAVVTAGEDIRRRLAPAAKRCISVQNYPDLNVFPASDRIGQSAPPQIVFLGGMNRSVVPVNLLSAIELVSRDLEFKVMWGGKRFEPEVLQQLTAHPGWDRVNFLGFVPFAEVNELMRQAHGAIVLYADAPNNYAVRSNRLFETMAVGLPIIGPSYGEWNAFLTENACGLTVNPDHPQEIADAIETLLREPEQAKEMGQSGRRAVEEKFNWGTEIDKLVQLYDQIMQE